MCIPGVGGAGKSTLGRALSRQVQLLVHRLDDEPDVRQLVEPELPDVYRWTDPQRYARCHCQKWHSITSEVAVSRPSQRATSWLSTLR